MARSFRICFYFSHLGVAYPVILHFLGERRLFFSSPNSHTFSADLVVGAFDLRSSKGDGQGHGRYSQDT